MTISATADAINIRNAKPPVSVLRPVSAKFDQFQVVCINITANRLRPVLLCATAALCIATLALPRQVFVLLCLKSLADGL